jgi:cytochrome c-type biogenesis protein CcsB
VTSVADAHLANLSNQLMLGTVLLYLVAMFGYASDLAFGHRRTAAAAKAAVAKAKVLAGAGGPEVTVVSPDSGETEVSPEDEAAEGRDWGRFAVIFTVLGWGAHLGEIVTRGMAANRIPWGNMYEFLSAISFAAVTVYLVLLVRQKIRFLGAFVMVAALILVGLGSMLYNAPGPLRPALHSYWIAIHVTAAIIATGTFTVAAVTTIFYLLQARREASGAEKASFLDRFPTADRLDGLSNKITMFGFPIWTFAIIAGAIWADEAWGKYWGWDPKETWSFVTFVVYAAYLHARATAGWKGRKAAALSLIAYGCLLFNFFGINFLVSGMHSYA